METRHNLTVRNRSPHLPGNDRFAASPAAVAPIDQPIAYPFVDAGLVERGELNGGWGGDDLPNLGPLDDSLHAGQSSSAFPHLGTPASASAAIASARRRARHGVQQSECSHAWHAPHPIGCKAAPGLSDQPHQAQRSDGVSGWVALRRSMRTASKAARSASGRDRPRIRITRATAASNA
jgi:hypothetical protein